MMPTIVYLFLCEHIRGPPESSYNRTKINRKLLWNFIIPDKHPHFLPRRTFQFYPHLVHKDSHKHCWPPCSPESHVLSSSWSVQENIYRNLCSSDTVWVTVGVVVFLHSPPCYLAVLRWPPGSNVSVSVSTSCPPTQSITIILPLDLQVRNG